MRKVLVVVLVGLLVASSIAGSLWKSGGMNLLTVRKASKVGDIVKVLVYEIPTASTKSSGINPIKGVIDFVSGILNKIAGVNTNDYVPFDDVQSSYNRENQVSAKVVLEVSSIVVGIDEYGNLIIEGEKKIKIGSTVKVMIVRGKVRPEDIGADNTVDSRNLAEAEIWVDDELVFKKNPDEPDSWLSYILASLAGLFM